MLKKYLVLSEDGALEVPPVYVMAKSASEAIRRYCREVQSGEDFYRDHIQDLRTIDGFAGKLLFSPEARAMATKQGLSTPQASEVRRKVMHFFESKPELGEQYLKYMDAEDVEVLSEELYQFVSERDTDGYDAIDDATVRTLS